MRLTGPGPVPTYSVSGNTIYLPTCHRSYSQPSLRHLFVVYTIYLVVLLAGVSRAHAQDVTTWHYNNARTGVQPNETVLTPSNVNYANFAKVFTLPVIGDVYAQPLYLSQYPMGDGQLHNVLLVATAEDYIYAFDADGKNPAQGYLWRQLLLGSGETWLTAADELNDPDIYPNIGIIGTPVVDRSGGTIYVVSRSKTTSGPTTYFQRLHALNIVDGGEKLNGPTTIQATVKGVGDGGTTITFNAQLQNQRSALLLAPTPSAGSGNSVFIAWASHGDQGAYHGWVIAYDAGNIAQQNGVWVDTPNGMEGGIWMSGGGLSSDNNGNIFVASGNGTFDASTGGSDYGDSALRLTLDGSGLAVGDYYAPANQSSLSNADWDMGSSAMMLLPTQSGAVPNLAVTADKGGQIYLLNRDHLGGYTTPDSGSLQNFADGGYDIRTNFAFFNNVIYMAPDGGPLQAWAFDPQTERFSTTPQSKSQAIFGCHCDGATGSAPSISANGTTNGIVWALDNIGFTYPYQPAILHAYDATNLTTELYNSSQAANDRDAAAVAVKFTTPTIANGRVYVAGRNAVTVYGLLINVETPTITLASNANPSVVGQAVTFTATITAPADLTKLPDSGSIIFDGLPGGNVTAPVTFAAADSGGPFQATVTNETADLPVGSTLITASFPGDNLLNAASASLTQVVNPPPSYQLVASPPMLELKAGATANNSVTITAKSLYRFAGTVTLSCAVASLGSVMDASPPTCGFGTTPLSVNGADVTTQLVLTTTAATSAGRKVAADRGLGQTGIALWGGVLLLLLPRRLRSRRVLAASMMLLIATASMLSLSSCGSSGSSPTLSTGAPGTQARNYSVTVSATSNTTAPAPSPVTIQLTVD